MCYSIPWGRNCGTHSPPPWGQNRGVTNTPVVKPRTYDPSCDLCSFALWNYDILYDCGIIILCMINLIKEL